MKHKSSYQDETRERKRRQLTSRITRVFVISFSSVIIIIGFFFFLHIFDVREVRVKSTSLVDREDLEQIANTVLDSKTLGIARRRNMIIFSPDVIREKILDTFPRVASVEIHRTSLHILTIDVRDRIAIGLWCLSKRELCYYYDEKGLAFSQTASSSGFLFIPIYDRRDRDIVLGSEVESHSYRDEIQEVKKLLQFGGITPSEIRIQEDPQDEFDVVTREGWKILYSRDTDIRKQSNNLNAFLKEKITPEIRQQLDYIDLRIDDRIYYKVKE